MKVNGEFENLNEDVELFDSPPSIRITIPCDIKILLCTW